jgi:hypothetical protein
VTGFKSVARTTSSAVPQDGGDEIQRGQWKWVIILCSMDADTARGLHAAYLWA